MRSNSAIKVLVVDDSSLMRSHICSILIEAGLITDTASNGRECLEKIKSFRPDVITLDINMPVMDGIECLQQIMEKHPMPVVMVSSLTQKNASETFQALDIGAVDYVAKPDGSVSLKLNREKYMLASKVISASKVKVQARSKSAVISPSAPTRVSAPPKIENSPSSVLKPSSYQQSAKQPLNSRMRASGNFAAVIIGVSTGGPNTLHTIIPKLPADYPYPIVIAQHMPARFTSVFAERLNNISALKVVELQSSQTLEKGTVYVAQGDTNIEIFSQGGLLGARPDSKKSPYIWRPSITKLVESAVSSISPKRLCLVQLTGMGNDGAQAMANANKQGATTIAESEQTAVVYGMPKELVKLGGASMVLPNFEIADALMSLR